MWPSFGPGRHISGRLTNEGGGAGPPESATGYLRAARHCHKTVLLESASGAMRWAYMASVGLHQLVCSSWLLKHDRWTSATAVRNTRSPNLIFISSSFFWRRFTLPKEVSLTITKVTRPTTNITALKTLTTISIRICISIWNADADKRWKRLSVRTRVNKVPRKKTHRDFTLLSTGTSLYLSSVDFSR